MQPDPDSAAVKSERPSCCLPALLTPYPVRRQLWSGRLSGVYWLLSWLPRWLQERIMNLRMHLAPVRPPHVKAD